MFSLKIVLFFEIIEFCQWDDSTCFPVQFLLIQEFPQFILRLKSSKIEQSSSFKKTKME